MGDDLQLGLKDRGEGGGGRTQEGGNERVRGYTLVVMAMRSLC